MMINSEKSFDDVIAESLRGDDAIRESMTPEEFQGYCKGNALRYLWCWRQKGGVEDLEKADVYLRWLIESAAKEETKNVQ